MTVVTLVIHPAVVGGIGTGFVIYVELGPPGAVFAQVAFHRRSSNVLVVLVLAVVHVGALNEVPRPLSDTLPPQRSHEQLQANQGEHRQAEESEDHHILQCFH